MVPTVRKCCFCFPLHPGALICAIVRFNFIIMMEAMYLLFFFKFNLIDSTPTLYIFIIEAVLVTDLMTITYFLYEHNPRDVTYLKKYYPFCVYTLGFKTLIFLGLAFVTHTILVTPYVLCLLLDFYMLVLLRSMMLLAEQEQGNCEFTNKIPYPDNVINIEVVDDSIPEMYKNRVYLVSDRYEMEEHLKKKNSNGEVKEENNVSVEQNSAENNKHEQENIEKMVAIPTVTHM